jgi:hypothetical protein
MTSLEITTLANKKWLEREEKILQTIRYHLREAHQNSAVGELFFRLEFKNGGLRRSNIGMKVEYEFVDVEREEGLHPR